MTSNVEATKKGYECFQRGDIPSLIRDLLKPWSQRQASLGRYF